MNVLIIITIAITCGSLLIFYGLVLISEKLQDGSKSKEKVDNLWKGSLLAFLIFLLLDSLITIDMGDMERYISYRELPVESHDLHEIGEGQYYKYEAGIDSSVFVTVYMLESNGGLEEHSYNKEIVSFEEGENNAKICIKKEEPYWSKEYRGFKFVGSAGKSKVSSVTIISPTSMESK